MKAGSTSAYASFGWLLLGLALLVMAFGGCGKKAPPVAPKSPLLPQVTTLEGHLEGDTIYLNWRQGDSVKGIKEYTVLRSQADPAKPPCPGCPRIFQRVGEVASAPDGKSVQFSEPTASGFIYTYKVQPLGPSGEIGPESNAVTIDRSTP